MRAVEFEGTVAPGGKIALPPEVADEIAEGEQIRIVVMWDPDGAERLWRTAVTRSFEAVYSPEDSVYEQLMDDSATR